MSILPKAIYKLNAKSQNPYQNPKIISGKNRKIHPKNYM